MKLFSPEVQAELDKLTPEDRASIFDDVRKTAKITEPVIEVIRAAIEQDPEQSEIIADCFFGAIVGIIHKQQGSVAILRQLDHMTRMIEEEPE
jgi:hypothetical protein